MNRSARPTRKLSGVASGLVAALAVLTTAMPASATPNFPAAIKDKLDAVSAPDCFVCHVGRVGVGTVNTAFGSSMRARGLQKWDTDSLGRALDAMESEKIDSDGDGTIDVDAIREGSDPNPAEAEDYSDETIPTYGCFSRLAPSAPPTGTWLTLGIVAALTVLRRRRSQKATPLLSIALIAAAMTGACTHTGSGAALAPRPDSTPVATPPRMASVQPSRMAEELRAVGIDLRSVPPFESLTPRQRTRVMSTFTRSLGVACTYCHDRNEPTRTTIAMKMATRMWNDMMRPYSFKDHAPLYCDSCHQGQVHILKRDQKPAIGDWMSENFTEKLELVHAVVTEEGEPPTKEIECENCHGDPAEPLFLAKWRR